MNQITLTLSSDFRSALASNRMNLWDFSNFINRFSTNHVWERGKFSRIMEDFNVLSYWIETCMDFNQFELTPLFCVLRSTIEKYADLVNFYYYGEGYTLFLNHLWFESQGRGSEEFALRNYEELKKWLVMKGVFSEENTAFANRVTRYYMLANFNSKFNTSFSNCGFESIILLNRKLRKLDSNFSSIIHDNPDFNREKKVKVDEILDVLLHVAYSSILLIAEIEHINLYDSSKLSFYRTSLLDLLNYFEMHRFGINGMDYFV